MGACGLVVDAQAAASAGVAAEEVVQAVSALRIGIGIESWGPGGAERMVLQLSEELRNRGHQVSPIMARRPQSWLAMQFRDLGFVPSWFDIRYATDPLLLIHLARTIRRRFDVFHGHEFTMAVYGAASASLARRPSVITMHGGTAFAAARRRRLALRWAARRSSAVVAVSGSARDFLAAECGIDPAAIEVIANGIRSIPPAGTTDVRGSLGLKPDELLVVAVGNLYEVKGHRYAIEALASIAGETSWHLALAGRGREEAVLRELAASRGVSHRVHFLGVRSDVPDLLDAADVFVMPSLSEGLPMALLEAMAAGCAVVASAVGGIPEVVDDGFSGMLVPPRDVPALTDALRCLLQDRSLRQRLAAKAAADVPDRFSVGRMADAYLALYRRCLRSGV